MIFDGTHRNVSFKVIYWDFGENSMMKNYRLLLIGSGLIAAATAYGQGNGPGANYYMADGTNLWTAFGASSISAPQASGNEFNIAVSGDIRTTQERNTGPGNQYTLGMIATGTQYNGTWGGFFDGTTDGTNNFTLDWDSGDVMRFDRNWQNGVSLFNVGGGGQYLGITYDGAGGLWISQWAGTGVEHRAMNGALLGGFSAGFNSITALAMDWSTGNLWMGTQNSLGVFSEFSQAGALLDVVTYSNMATANTLGGEFDRNPVPEPASLAVLGIGALALLRRKRTK